MGKWFQNFMTVDIWCESEKIIAHSYWCLCSKFSFNFFNHAGEALMWVHSVCFVLAQIGQCWSVHLGVSQSSDWCSCWLQWEHMSLSSQITIRFDFDRYPSIPLLLSPLISSSMPAWCNVDDLGVGDISTWLKDGGAGKEGECPWGWILPLRRYSWTIEWIFDQNVPLSIRRVNNACCFRRWHLRSILSWSIDNEIKR